MARKQKAKVFNKFLDLIGIVDTADNNQDDDFDADFDTIRPRGRTAAKNSSYDSEFDDEPRMTRVQTRRERPTAHPSSSANDYFDADEGWGETVSSRPEYGARTQQRAQSKARPSANRYGSEQRSGANSASRNSGRYENTPSGDDYYRGSSSYQNGDYQQTSYRSNASSYAGYGATSRRYEFESSYGAAPIQEQYSAGRGTSGQQRHQTVIFKLRSVDECKGVILALIEKKSVLLNLDDLDSLQAQRTLDTMSGATFAIGARLSRASDRTWLITPSTVEVADSQAENTGSYGSTSRYM